MIADARPLLSRVADAVYWTARYIERAENIARYVAVNLNLQLGSAGDPDQQWQPIVDVTGDADYFKEHYGEATRDSVIEFLLFDQNYLNSISSCLRAARENARSVREIISSEMWAQVNSMYLQIQSNREMPAPEQLLDTFRDIRLGCHLFQGITDSTMTHNEPWHFMRLGRKLERADKTSRILDVKYFILLPSVKDVGTPYDDIHWAAMLKSVSGFAMYRKKFGRIVPRNIVEFLVLDREFPRSVHFCVRSASESLQAITGSQEGYFRYRTEQLMGMLRAELGYTSFDTIMNSGLHEYLDGLQDKMNAIDRSLIEDFVTWNPRDHRPGTGLQAEARQS